MTEFTRHYGVYDEPELLDLPLPIPPARQPLGMDRPGCRIRPPGVVIPWEEKRKEFPETFTGDEQLVRRIWEECDAMAYTYIWQVLLSF